MSVRGTTPSFALGSSMAGSTLLDVSNPLSGSCARAVSARAAEFLAEPVTEAVPSTLLDAFRATLRQAAPPGRAASRSGVPFPIHGETPDEELARTACEGDPRAAIAIWRRYGMQVRSKLLRWIGAHDLDDHVQEVFSRLFEQLPRLRQPSALRSFLIGITLRVACTELRRRRRWRLRLTATGELPDLAEHHADDGAARQALSRFEAILAKLSPRTRRVFVLRYVEKMELVDVAAAMDISLATAKRHLGRASMRVFAMAEREPALVDYLQEMRSRTLATAATAVS